MKASQRGIEKISMKPTRILSVDPGFAQLGIAVIEKKPLRGQSGRTVKQEELVYSACFKTPAKLQFSNRLLAIGNEIERVIKKYNPQALAIETLFFNTNQKTAMRVAETRGIVMFISKKNKLKIFEYTPLQIKISITGYGKAIKDQIAAMIPQLIELNNKSKKLDDELDAIAIGLTHIAHLNPVEK